MTEEKEYPNYNINVGVATSIKSLIEIETFKYHPYGLEKFRKNIIEQVEEWQNQGLSWNEHDNLTHAWRTPWDTHIRYPDLMNPIAELVNMIVKNHAPVLNWMLEECWISEYVNNSGANRHCHGDDSLGWSFCYYVKVPDEGPAFTFFDDITESSHQINVTTGDLLLFRHPLYHQVLPALSQRIIISGNIHANRLQDQLIKVAYTNDNFMSDLGLLDLPNNSVDVDDWSNEVYLQKFKVDLESGY